MCRYIHHLGTVYLSTLLTVILETCEHWHKGDMPAVIESLWEHICLHYLQSFWRHVYTDEVVTGMCPHCFSHYAYMYTDYIQITVTNLMNSLSFQCLGNTKFCGSCYWTSLTEAFWVTCWLPYIIYFLCQSSSSNVNRD